MLILGFLALNRIIYAREKNQSDMLIIILWHDSMPKIMQLRCTVWTESQKMCRFRGLTESKSDDKNVRQSAIFHQILLKFETQSRVM